MCAQQLDTAKRSDDEQYLAKAIRLAGRAGGWANPNPKVGAIIVKDGQIIGKGYHKKVGGPHAEIEAIRSCNSQNLKGATLYISLEPCVHYARTPPCCDAVIKSGIKRVVCSILDPNPLVYGKGIAKLKRAGVDVSIGAQAEMAKTMNESYFTFHEKKRPFIALKFASSLDGKLATRTEDSKWITNEHARSYARRLRGDYQSILVGVNTVIKDDPHLGPRTPDQPEPKRIILDPHLRTPLSAKVLRDRNVLVVTSTKASQTKLKQLGRKDIDVLTFKSENIPLEMLAKKLHEMGIVSIMVEGGGETLGSFIDSKLVDKVYAFFGPLLIGGRDATTIKGKGAELVSNSLHLSQTTMKSFEDNLLVTGYIEK